MKELVRKLYNDPKNAKLVYWGKLISITGSAQLLIQALGLVSGILIIRLLPTKEYALYTLVNTMLGTMTVLADSGIGDGTLSQGGRIWKDPRKLGAVIATGLTLRSKFAIGSLAVTIPALVYMLMRHGASLGMTILLIVALIPSFFVALSSSILNIAPRLHQDIYPMQKYQLVMNIIRLVVLCMILFIFPFAYIALIAAFIPQIWSNIQMRKLASGYADPKQKPDPLVQKEILKVVKRTMPGAVFYCFSSQITTWLISIFGTTLNIAQVGALNRLAVLLNVFTIMFATLAIPRFARLQLDKKLLLKRFLQIQGVLFLISIIVVLVSYFFAPQILLILGAKYSSLTAEVVIVMLGACLAMMTTLTGDILLARSWVIHPVLQIGVNLGSQIVLICLMNLSKMQNILWFSVLNNLVVFLLMQSYFFYRIIKAPDASDPGMNESPDVDLL